MVNGWWVETWPEIHCWGEGLRRLWHGGVIEASRLSYLTLEIVLSTDRPNSHTAVFFLPYNSFSVIFSCSLRYWKKRLFNADSQPLLYVFCITGQIGDSVSKCWGEERDGEERTEC